MFGGPNTYIWKTREFIWRSLIFFGVIAICHTLGGFAKTETQELWQILGLHPPPNTLKFNIASLSQWPTPLKLLEITYESCRKKSQTTTWDGCLTL